MGTHPRISLWLGAGLFVVALAIGSMSGSGATDSSALEMRRAVAFYDSALVHSRDVKASARRDDAAVLAFGYLDRLRLGLGSPFRLLEQVRADPRLDDSTRSRLAWALLGRLRRGDAYVVDSAVLDDAGPWRDSTSFATGADHIALIRRAVESSTDARAGELAVRVAYQIAATERTIGSSAVPVAAQVAALERDRVDARRDLDELASRAAVEHRSLLDAVVLARQERLLRSERPPAEALPAELQLEAMREVPTLLASIHALGIHRDGASPVTNNPPILDASSGARLAQLGSALPPQTPVAIATRVWRAAILHASEFPNASVRQFIASTNEEQLAGSYASLEGTGIAERETALAMLATAVQLRAFAQEDPWFPGMPAPSASEVVASYGLRELRFDNRVPVAWRPYFTRMVASGIADMQRVLPAFSLDGVSVRFGLDDLPDSALAMHDPASRTLRFSIYSSAGTFAHEFAHDLDWQSARRLFPHGGGYGTDRAIREQRGPLASPMRGLATARLGVGATQPETRERPAELFARDVDWFVTSSLARLGRSNGYLSAVQDVVLTGYTPASPRELLGGPGVALVDALAQMTFVPDDARGAFLDTWSDQGVIDPFLLARTVAEARLPRRAVARSVAFRDDAALAVVGSEPPSCESVRGEAPEMTARRRVLELALDARALGVVRRWAGWYMPAARPAWANSVLGVAPYSPELGASVTRRVRSALVSQLESGTETSEPLLAALATFRPEALSCASRR